MNLPINKLDLITPPQSAWRESSPAVDMQHHRQQAADACLLCRNQVKFAELNVVAGKESHFLTILLSCFTCHFPFLSSLPYLTPKLYLPFSFLVFPSIPNSQKYLGEIIVSLSMIVKHRRLQYGAFWLVFLFGGGICRPREAAEEINSNKLKNPCQVSGLLEALMTNLQTKWAFEDGEQLVQLSGY